MQEEQLKDHGVWQLLLQAHEHLSNYAEDQQRTVQFAEARERIDYIRWILEQSDPALLTKQELDSVQGPLQHAVNHISQSTGNSKGLSQLDQWFAPFIEKFPYPRVRKIFRSERTEILNEFEREILNLQSQVQDFFGSAKQKQHVVESQIDKSLKTTEGIEKSLSAIEARVNAEFENWEARASQQISERMSELSSRFTEDQASRSADHQTKLDEIAGKLREIESKREEAQSKLAEVFDEVKKEASAENEEIILKGEEFLQKIKEIYNISGQTALAGDFENAAKSENISGIIFASFAAIFFIITPFFFVYQWSNINLESTDPLALLFKLSAGLAFLIPAAYFGNSSRRHHRVATALRSLGIKVATFDAYLANFPDT